MYQHKPVSMAAQCLAIVLQRPDGRSVASIERTKDGSRVFQSFQEENRTSFWNPALVDSVNSLEFVGFMRPNTLLVSGTELHLECLRGAWARRVLKPPRGFAIKTFGDIGGIEMQEVPQTQFIPLPETLCVIISSLNKSGHPATLDTVAETLQHEYNGMTMPRQEVIFAALAALASEGKIYCMGDHYFVSTPQMYQQFQANFGSSNRGAMYLRQTDAAPYFMSVPSYQTTSTKQELCSRECQTGASIVGGPAYKPKKNQASTATTNTECQTQTTTTTSNERSVGRSRSLKEKEKPGFFARLFRRSKSRDRVKNRQTSDPMESPSNANADLVKPTDPPAAAKIQTSLDTFSAQFPPTEWLVDPRFVRAQAQPFKSRRGRTEKPSGSKERHTTWAENDPKASIGAGHRGAKERRFSNQRYCTFPENLNQQLSPPQEMIIREKPPKPHKTYQRMSKYMSSSSECLHYLGPVDPPNMLPKYAENEGMVYVDASRRKEKSRRNRNTPRHFKQDPHLLALEKLQVSEPLSEVIDQDLTETDQQQLRVDSVEIVAPLAVPTDAELDTTGEASGCRTSTPVDKRSDQGPVVELQSTTIDVETYQNNSDSAFSASPVVTEMSSGDSNKYSSWSGSEGQRPNEPKFKRDILDHTYVNLDHRAAEIPKSEQIANDLPITDLTYENLDQHRQDMDSTQFENVTNLSENTRSTSNSDTLTAKKLAPTYISAV